MKEASKTWLVSFNTRSLLMVILLLTILLEFGCAHYPVNEKLEKYNPDAGYKMKNMGVPGNSDGLLLLMSFSGGGTRAAAFSYGVLEEFAKTEVTIDGKEQRLLDEIDVISSVSGGSFTSGYYGLFGDRIFEDFEERFLKKNIQGALFVQNILRPVSWISLFSPYYGRSDIAAKYYDKHVFDGGTFGDMLSRKGPMILINTTDMTLGSLFFFSQGMFDRICSDMSSYKVARAAAASSAVPIVLSPLTLHNYAGSCGYEVPTWLEETLEKRDTSSRRYQQALRTQPYLDAKSKPYIHLMDGGISDNLGLRVVIDVITKSGNFWDTIKRGKLVNTHKIVFVVVNAETEIDTTWDLLDRLPKTGFVIKSATSVPISNYNFETVALLRESFKRWSDEVRTGRCNDPRYRVDKAGNSSGKGACDDIEFYLVEVNFDSIADESERSFLKQLPTSFKLPPESVDKLRDAAHTSLVESKEFQRLLNDLK